MPEAILEQLDGILSSQSFKGSERSSRLLRFLVEQTVSGQADRLKEYTLGTEALGKHSSFDPRIDPAVRSEASRLRTRLDKYYATEGRDDVLVIALPKGGYVPLFHRRPVPPASAVFAEIAQGGDKRTQPPAESKSPPHAASMARSSDTPAEPPQLLEQQLVPVIGALRQAKTRTVGWMLLAGLAAALGVFLLYQFALSTDTTTAKQTAKADLSSPTSLISIAVLPFVNLSGDASQEFFSDGMTEEIMTALAKIPGLQVVARASAFQFKGQNRDIRAIGQALQARHVIDGSVRIAGDRVRITVQLVEANRGVNVWAESYDRQLASVFATQEDIATSVAGALRLPLGLKPGESLVSSRNIDPESYQQYLHAKALVRGLGLTEAAALLEQVVASNPGYAPAWALLAQAYDLSAAGAAAGLRGVISGEYRRFVDSVMPRADAAAQRAIQLDPNLADGYLALGLIEMSRSKSLAAEELYSKALALDPNNPEILAGYAHLLASVGRLKDSVAMWQRLQNMEPFVPVYNQYAAVTRWINGQTDDAIAVLKPLRGNAPARFLAQIYAAMGRYGEAADLLHAITNIPPQTLAEAERLLRLAPTKVAAPQSLPRLEVLSFVYLHVGASSRIMDWYERLLEGGFHIRIVDAYLWHPSYAPVRKTERFKAYARKAGLVDYWRAKGWPEFCRPTTGDDFACD